MLQTMSRITVLGFAELMPPDVTPGFGGAVVVVVVLVVLVVVVLVVLVVVVEVVVEVDVVVGGCVVVVVVVVGVDVVVVVVVVVEVVDVLVVVVVVVVEVVVAALTWMAKSTVSIHDALVDWMPPAITINPAITAERGARAQTASHSVTVRVRRTTTATNTTPIRPIVANQTGTSTEATSPTGLHEQDPADHSPGRRPRAGLRCWRRIEHRRHHQAIDTRRHDDVGRQRTTLPLPGTTRTSTRCHDAKPVGHPRPPR